MSDPDKLAELTALADSIGTAGAAEDGALGTLAKGMADMGMGVADALRDAIGLLSKGGTAHLTEHGKAEGIQDDHLENDRGGEGMEGPDMDGSEEEEADGEGDSYEDMELGQEGYVDVTEFVAAMHKGQTATFNLLKGMEKRMIAAETENASLRSLVEGSIKLTAGTVGPLAKGVQDLADRVSRISEQPMELGGQAPWRTPTRRALEVNGVVPGQGVVPAVRTPLGGDAGTELRLLTKAMGRGIIGEDAIRRYKQTGQFAIDEAANTEIRQAVLSA